MFSRRTDNPAPRFQSRRHAWHPDREDVFALLAEAEHAAIRPLYYGSNECFLLTLEHETEGRSRAIYKPAAGEYHLHDFAAGTLYRREVAAAAIDRYLGWHMIPPTVETDGVYGPGSLQLFIEGHAAGEIEVVDLRRLALLDVILNNADRKPEHCLVGDGNRLWGIDHGLTFHVQPKLRTILWHFAGMPLTEGELADLESLADALEEGTVKLSLEALVSRAELAAFRGRVLRTVHEQRFPDPLHKPVPYRW